MATDIGALTATRRSLHGVAELLLAGPQHARFGKITLRPAPGGFATTHTPGLYVDGVEVVLEDRRVAMDGRTLDDVGRELGIDPAGLAHVYADGSGIDPGDVLRIEAACAAELAAAFALGDQALREFAPEATPVLWPEHFDLGITVNEVNYGVSPGDGFLAAPYAYVGPWSVPPGEFWNAPFGAARLLSLFDGVGALVAFFAEGRDLA
jgi:hypothetical protein